MKKLITVLLITLMILSLSACATKTTNKVVKGESSRMVRIEEAGIYQIVYDKETRVMYAVSYGVNNGGVFTLLVDADGKPLLYEGGTGNEVD